MNKMFGWNYARVVLNYGEEFVIRMSRDKFGAYQGNVYGIPVHIDRDWAFDPYIVRDIKPITFSQRPAPKLRLVVKW